VCWLHGHWMTDPPRAGLPWLTPSRCAYLIAAVLSLALGYDLLGIPIQVSDSLGQLLDVQRSPSLYETFAATARRGAYMRPMFLASVDILFDLSRGHYWLTFRGFHAAMLAAAILLFVRALQVRTWQHCAAAAFALTVFTGATPFLGTVREAFPVSHFLMIVLSCLVALNLVRSAGGWWVDVAAVVTFAIASMTIESGLLVWVVVAVSWMVGMRGVSSRGVVAMTACLALYFGVRWYLSTGMPGLEERSSGFLLRMVEPEELIERFGANPLPFYAYNVVTSILSVLFSDPDGGVFELARAWLLGDVPPRLYLVVVSSTLTTGLIGWTVVRRIRGRAQAGWTSDAQLLMVAGAVIVGNAAISYAYTKHEIISVAGAFYAVAAFVAARHVAESWDRMPRRAGAVAVLVLYFVAASIWTFRSAGVHHILQAQAFRVRNDWARLSTARWQGDSDDERRSLALVRQLRRDALEARVVNPYRRPRWQNRWWGE